jgi:hypothetical protein
MKTNYKLTDGKTVLNFASLKEVNVWRKTWINEFWKRGDVANYLRIIQASVKREVVG